MCIRDRRSAQARVFVARAHAKDAKEAKSAKKPSSLRSLLCLLYTSDAADERSSVDLGGRRIIKKKKRDGLTHLLHTNI